MGATATGISLYQYESASDVDALSEFVGRVMRSEIDVITFTNGPQAQFLLKFAGTQGNGAAFLDQLRERVVVASIGEVTARAVGELGIRSQIVPDEPKMGPLVRAIADFFEKRKQGCSTLSS
jgi:uroporphyrinogen-III synthase